MEALMIQILKDEVKPATGCTEPVAVAFAVAKARAFMEMKLAEKASVVDQGYTANPDSQPIEFEDSRLTVKVSPNLFKNGLGVGIPNCNLRGLSIAASLGLWACDANAGLKVFEVMAAEQVDKAADYVSQQKLNLEVLDTSEKVRVETALSLGDDRLELVLSGTHDHIESVTFNGREVYAKAAAVSSAGLDKSQFFNLHVKELVETVAQMPTEGLAFLKDGLEMNKLVAAAGLKESMGMGVGYGLHQCIEDGEMGDDLVTKAMYLTAAASDARMSGLNMTVMSSNGSGNNGLTAILPLAAYFETHEVSEADQLRALAMSHLINCYVKERIGRLSAMCSCAISAATGSGAAIAWLLSKKTDVVLSTIQNMTGNLSGMICDGAKEGCAMKLATGAAAGVQAALLASHGVVMPAMNGIVGHTAEESIEHLGILSRQGMQLTDGVILDMMKSMM